MCKPYAAHDKADAVRFLRELGEGCNGTDDDADWTLGDVSRGLHIHRIIAARESQAILAAFKQFDADHAKQLEGVGGEVLKWHRDNEITSTDIEEHCMQMATKSTFSIPYEL